MEDRQTNNKDSKRQRQPHIHVWGGCYRGFKSRNPGKKIEKSRNLGRKFRKYRISKKDLEKYKNLKENENPGISAKNIKNPEISEAKDRIIGEQKGFQIPKYRKKIWKIPKSWRKKCIFPQYRRKKWLFPSSRQPITSPPSKYEKKIGQLFPKLR